MRILLGILIILLGLQLALSSAGIGNVPTLGTWWPIVLIIIAVMSWRANRHSLFGPIILFLLGLTFLMSNLDWLPGNGWSYTWPIFMILIGLRILYGKQWRKRKTEGGGKDVVAAFSGHEENVSGAYTGGNITAIFGGSQLDLRNADIQDNATIEVFAAFGGAEIFVPTDVLVTTNVTPIFGGAANKTKPSDAIKTLRITGTALFGGVEVKN